MSPALPICGIKGFAGCNSPIGSAHELYRCTDCSIAFHKACLLSHFRGAHNPHPLREGQLMQALAAKDAEIHGLRHGKEPD